MKKTEALPPQPPALILSAAHLSIDPSSLIIWGPLGPIVKNKSLGPLDGLRAWRYICLALNGTKLTKHLQGKCKEEQKRRERGRKKGESVATAREANEKRGNGRRTK